LMEDTGPRERFDRRGSVVILRDRFYFFPLSN
jgi:hypothetical protein